MQQLSFQNQIDDCMLASDKEWREEARKYARLLAELRQTFTSEMILNHLDKNGYKTKDNRALGAIMQSLVRDGVIKPIGYTQATRPERHKAPVRVWESLIRKDNA